MTTQGGSNNTETQAKVNIAYSSTGYVTEIENLKKLETIIGDIKLKLGNITLPQIKGLKGALTEIESLRHSINTLQAGGRQVSPQDVVTKKAYHTGLDEGLKLQRQEAELTKKQLQNKAYLGILTKDEIKEQSKNLEYLKAINKGFEQRQQAGHTTDKTLKTLTNQRIKTLEDGVRLERETQNRKKLQERLEANNMAKRYAREAVERTLNKADLKSQLGKSDLPQLRAFERAMNAEKSKAGYIETPQVKEFSKQVSNRIKAETAPKVDLKASDIVQKIAAGKFEQAEVNHAIAQLRKQLTHATNTGADRGELVKLHQGLLDVRKAGAEKFAPVSPFQEAKKSEEAHAKNLLTSRFNKKTIAEASTRQIEEQLQASKILGHKTLAPFGSTKYQKEMGYQKFLTDTLKARALETPEAKEAAERKKSASEKFQVSQNELKEAKKLLPLTREQLDKVTSQAEIEKHLHAIKVRGLKLGQEGYETEVQYRGQLKERLAAIRQEVAAEKKRLANPVAHEVSEYRKEIQATIQTPTQLNIARNAQRLSQKINLENAKHSALGTNKYTTKAALEALPVSELKTARDTLNYGLKQGLRLKPEVFKELIEYTKTLEKAEVKRIRKVEKEKENADKLAKVRADNDITRIKNEIRATEDLVKLKMLQRQLNTRLNAEVKADPKSSQVEAAERVKLELAQKIKNLGVATTGAAAQNRQTAAERAAQKARDDKAKADAFAQGRFNTQEQTKNLKGQDLKFAADTLKFALGTGKVAEDQVKSVKEHLDVLQKRVREEARSNQQNQNLANLAHKYNTVAEIKNLKTKEEAELARKVVGYRMRTQQYDEQGLINQQKLLDAAKRQDQLLGSRDKRQDKEVQHEKRLTQLTHLEGDGGASMAIIQAGFMMRSQVLGGLSSIFSGAFDSAIQLDKAFRNLQAISASTNYEMATMKVNLINVAQASKFSASEVGETAVMLAQAGLSIQEIGASMKGIITLAQATGTDLAKSVDVVTSVLSIFNKSATETDTIVNQLTAALNESKLDINKMALGLQYAGNIASDSGVSFEELTAALGATANAGIRSGSTLGTGLRQMFIDLQKPNEKLTKRLETLGITLDQVSFRSQGLEGVLRNLRNAGFSSADAFETFEVRSAAAFSALSGNLTDFHDLQEELLDTNAAFEANNVQMESFAVQIDHLKSNLGILAADGLGPVLSLLRDMTKGMAHSMQNAEEGTGVINVLTTAFVSLMTGVTIAWFARLTAGITTTTAALLATRGALSLYWYGIIGVVAAGATFIASIMSQRNEVERLNTALDKTRGKYNDLKASLQSKESALANVNDALKNLVDRYGVLKNDSSQTQAVTKSLQEQFNQFGLELDDVADNKIDNVINKVRDLRAELAKELKQTIIEEAAAKIKLQNEERLKAEADLKEANIGGTKLGFNRASFEQFLHYTSIPDSKLQMFSADGKRSVINGRGYVTDQQRALRDNLAVRSLFLDLYAGAIRTQSEGKILPTKAFNPDQIMLDLRNKIAEVKDAEPARLLTEAVDNLKAGLDNITTVIENPEKVRKINEKTNRDVRTIDLQEKFNDPKAIGGASEAKIATLNAEINAIGDIKGLSAKEKRKRQSAAAKPVLEWFEKNIASAETYIESLPNEFDRETFKDLMAAVQARRGEVRKILVDNDKQFRKEQLDLLTRQIKAAEEDVRFAEEQHKDSSGLITEERTYVSLENKRKALNKLRFDKAEIESKDADNAEAHIAALRQEVEIEAKRNERERQKKIKAIKDNANAAANTNLNTADKARLDAKKKDLDAFYKDIKNREKTLEGRQEAERFQATAKTYRPLTTGNMFDQLNTDEKKEAQAKANATGVSQEYSVFGKAKAAFSRQAARFDNESLQKKQVQEKLALETAILFDLQQRKQNLSIEEYNKLKAEQITLEAEVTRLNNIAADARADKHPEDLKLAQEALQRNKDAIEYHREAEEKLTQDIETRNNTIENLKNNLQALIDKYDLLDTTMSAGVQSMTSGLSSIFSDWASGVIKNTDDVKEAFRSLGQSVLQSMAKVVSDRIAQQFMGFLLNGLGNFFGGSGEINLGMGPPKTSVASTGGLITTSGVKHFARGGEVTGTNIGRDSVPAYLQPNEYVVQRSAVQALGTDFMQNLNNVTTGSLKQGAANLGGSKPMVQNVMKSSPPVNVYVVSPEQQRQMSQQDVVVALQDDILRGGATKKLIKAVITGEI